MTNTISREGCFIAELYNLPNDPAVSVAPRRVERGAPPAGIALTAFGNDI